MKLLKQALAVLGALVVLMAIVALVAPKRARAVVAALVQVTNTETNPVPTISTNAHNSFVAEGTCYFDGSNDCFMDPLYTVPAGDIAVLEYASAGCGVSTGTAPISAVLAFTNPDGSTVQVVIPTNPAVSVPQYEESAFTVGQSLKTYASGGAGGNPINVVINTNTIQPSGFASSCSFDISGHLAPQ